MSRIPKVVSKIVKSILKYVFKQSGHGVTLFLVFL